MCDILKSSVRAFYALPFEHPGHGNKNPLALDESLPESRDYLVPGAGAGAGFKVVGHFIGDRPSAVGALSQEN